MAGFIGAAGAGSPTPTPGVDTTAWHNTGDSFGAVKKIGTLDAYDFIGYCNGIPLSALGTDKNIYFGNVLTHEATNGLLKYHRSDYWTTVVLKCDQDGSGGIGTGESQLSLQNDIGHNVVLNSMGSAYAGTTYGVANADQGRVRSDNANLIIGTVTGGGPVRLIAGNNVAVIITTDPHFTTACPAYIGTTTPVANEELLVAGYIRGTTKFALGAGQVTDPTYSMELREDVTGLTTSIIVDNRHASGQAGIWIGSNPRGSNSGLGAFFDNASDTAYITCGSTGGTIIQATGGPLVLKGGNALRMTMDSTGLGFYTHATVAQQTITGNRLNPESALKNLLTGLAASGLIVDSTTAT